MRNDSLLREIIVVLALKIAALAALWYLFFGQPLDSNLDGGQIGRVLFETNSAQAVAAPREPHHDH